MCLRLEVNKNYQLLVHINRFSKIQRKFVEFGPESNVLVTDSKKKICKLYHFFFVSLTYFINILIVTSLNKINDIFTAKKMYTVYLDVSDQQSKAVDRGTSASSHLNRGHSLRVAV